MKIDNATSRQILAADPKVSTWLSANAGSGKTKVLTDRVARLLLDGTSPQNILCLTYTKAAASEMQNRLFKRLGEWSMMDEVNLAKELEALGAPKISGPESLAFARTLFARAIDTPGGLRIQTIHSFCASLLRRFPLEAGVSPMFREMEERASNRLREDVVESMANSNDSKVVVELSKNFSGEDFSALTAGAVRYRDSLQQGKTTAEVWEHFGLPDGFDEAALLSKVFLGNEKTLFDAMVPALLAGGKSNDAKAAQVLTSINFADPDTSDLSRLFPLFLFGLSAKKSTPFSAKTDQFPTKDVREAIPDQISDLNGLMARVEEGRENLCQLSAANKTRSYYAFANVFLPLYEARKSNRGWLDFNDLISRARKLLSDPAVAQWVLFRLDGGLDHILVDEAQDTSPDQWKVIELLAQEFSAGFGARPDITRTIFVVGDLKQSIYSFQGADPRAFDKMRQHFSTSLADSHQTLFERSLDHSFRSSPAVLALVDSVFNQDGIKDPPTHLAFHSDMPGRVDLWAIIEKTPDPEEREWYDPKDMVTADSHKVLLAEKIAEQIKMMVESETIMGKNGKFRPVRYDDFLVLVQSRSELFHQIIRACKSKDLPIAGADRLKIGAETAVKDLRALLSFLAMPMDSLSLATALRSPIFGLTEAGLFDLAHGRKEIHLWDALVRRKDDFLGPFSILSELRNQVDFLRPFELLERILTRHGGRENLLARLGPEAEDGIDALLTQAVVYEMSETASLTGFLVWMDADGIEIKRQSDTASGRIRVMTTHGAKGLESPIVILPDTGDRKPPPPAELIPSQGGFLMWRTNKELQPKVMNVALTKLKTAHDEEMSRLLYVALTRAEKWLIVCGSGSVKEDGSSWYRAVEAAMLPAGAANCDLPTGPGLRIEHGSWQPRTDVSVQVLEVQKLELPQWATTSATAPTPNLPTLSPSDLSGEHSLPVDTRAQNDFNAVSRGRQIHRLLEHLPNYPQSEWSNIAEQLVVVEIDLVAPAEQARILQKAMKIIQNPDFSHIFGPYSLAEVSVSAEISELDNRRIHGVIDRLVVTDGQILVVDFKSNQKVPASPSETPNGILRQMAAYLAALRQIYPEHTIELSILWTETAELMSLPHDIVRAALH